MATTSYRFTVADLENLPDDDNRYEVIDGELYVSKAPHADHQDALDEIVFALRAWDRHKERGWQLSGIGIIFAFDAGVIPDLVWVSVERLAAVFIDPTTGGRDGKLHAAPDLAVEILSPGERNEQRDRETKLKLYSRQGVREYWIVDRERQAIQVYRRVETAQLEMAATFVVGDTLRSPLLPGFALSVGDVFRLPEPFRP
jgi:Uma2 family endonuclease